MKTIIVIYSNEKLNNKIDIGKHKRYAFNISSKIKVNDLIESSDYDTNMQVIKILTKPYKYYNRTTGELSDTYTSTAQWEVRTLIIRDNNPDETVVYGRIL
jgi:hypothetical protein